MAPAPTMHTRSTLRSEYLSAVTCQSTWLGLDAGGHPPELWVRDEAPLLRARALYGLEQRRIALLRDIEAELGHFDPDRVEPALLAEHDPALGADELGRVRLDRGRVVELRRHS